MIRFLNKWAAAVLVGTLLLTGASSSEAAVALKSTDWTGGAFGSVSTGAAGTTTGAGDGWIDVAGGIASLSGGNTLQMAATVPGVQVAEQMLLRPLSETCLNQQIQTTFLATASKGHPTACRVNLATGTLYQINCSTNTSSAPTIIVTKYKPAYQALSSNSTTTTGSNQTGAAVTATDQLLMTVTCTGTSTVTITVTLFDVTTSTTLINAASWTDVGATYEFQQPGQMGVIAPGGTTSLFQKIATFNNDTAAAATTYTVQASPNSSVANMNACGVVNQPITVSASLPGVNTSGGTNQFTAGATITFTQTGTATGSFSAATDTIGGASNKQSAVVTWTSTAAGTLIFTATSAGVLTDPAALTINSTVIGIGATGHHQSPANWSTDTGRTGTKYLASCWMGAYIELTWTDSAASGTALLSVLTPPLGFATSVSYWMDGIYYFNMPCQPSGVIPVPYGAGNGGGSHRLVVTHNYNSQPGNQWAETGNVLLYYPLVLPSTATATVGRTNGQWVLIEGDSITAGLGPNTNMQVYSYLLRMYLEQRFSGMDLSIRASPGQGWLLNGAGSVPMLTSILSGTSTLGAGGTFQNSLSSMNFVDGSGGGLSLLDSNSQISGWGNTNQMPSVICTMMGVNDAANGTGGSGSGATATSTVAGNAVTAVTVTAGGTNYPVAPNVVFAGGGGSGVTATAIVNTSGVITSVVVNTSGTGYTSAPSVSFIGGKSDLIASINSYITQRRTQAPSASITEFSPFGAHSAIYFGAAYQTYLTTFAMGVSKYLSANPSDAKSYFVDMGTELSRFVASAGGGGAELSGVHFNAYGHSVAAMYMSAVIDKYLSGSTTVKRKVQ